MSKLKQMICDYAFMSPYLILFGAFLVGPLIYGLGLSFMRYEMLSPNPPGWIGFDNFAEALSDRYFWKALFATLMFVVLTVPLTVVFALLLATFLTKIPDVRAQWYRAAIFLPTLITISVGGILWRWFYNSEFGLFNALLEPLGIKVPWINSTTWAMPSIVLMTLWWTIGGPMIILFAGMKQIPNNYYEAGSLDGATGYKAFIHLTLPLLRPVMLFVVVMSLIGAFQVFGQTYMITSGGPELSTRVLVQYIYETAFSRYRLGYGAAMSWLLFVIIGIISFAGFRIMGEKDA
ncbi:carbohydrate ABC transporter permease [Poriferisphaera sp. WC338]|uniref:carbohydrate ABC transporter permease n=1 Tax=Poriferisphaera sp. WC338 TaxID=3425129 RepID=UPI003D817440